MIAKYNFNPQCITYSQMNLIYNARIYYRRLIIWTRIYLISRYFGIGSPEELFGRLYSEYLEIGNMFRLIFGRDISNQYSQLVSEFAIGLRGLLSAQTEGNTEAINSNVERLYQNVKDRAAFLAGINPYWSEAEYINLFETYVQYTIEEANSIAAGDYSKDIETFDRLASLSNRMGDTLAQGLYEYITSGQPVDLQPQNIQQCLTYEQVNAIYNIRMFWFELNYWTRTFMLSRYTGLGNVNEVHARLKQVPVNYVNNLKLIFGENAAIDALLVELNSYIDLIDALITAQMEGNTDEVNRITQLLYQNADDRAASVSSLNPFWDQNEWTARLYNNLRSTINESNTFLTKDYTRNLDIFGSLLNLADNTSGYFAQGLVNYIENQPK